MGRFSKDQEISESSDTQKAIQLRKDIEKLEKLYESNKNETENLKMMIDDLHRKLSSVEKAPLIHSQENETLISIDNLILRKKIVIKNRKKSSSFANWLFNNKDL